MKTSFKLLTLAIVITFATTAAINFKLRAVYLTGDYKNPDSAYEIREFKDFDSIEIVAANLISARITHGDKFIVKLHEFAQGVRLEQKGSRLIVRVAADINGYYPSSRDVLLIECPVLKEIRTDGRFTVNGKPKIARKNNIRSYQGGRVLLTGFTQDSLSIVMNNFNKVFLRENNLQMLRAEIGVQDSSRSTLDLDRSNKINSADFNVQQSSILVLKDVMIKNFKYNLSDSAQVSLSGISLQMLSKK